MNHLKMIQQFLAEKRDFEDLPEYGFPFVTVSRQAGAGGHLLSYVILTEFLKHKAANPVFEGWHVFDKELTEVVAQDPLLQSHIAGLVAEKYKSQFNDFVESLFTGQSEMYLLQRTTFKVVRMLALIGKVIMVGRGGSLVTADLHQGIHIRLVAPEGHRIVWMMKRFKLNKEDARSGIERQDAERRKLIKLFFQRDIEDPLLYDMVWNTGKVGLDVITRSTIELIKQRATGIPRKTSLT
ncbi:MAG: cytidylate kinase-like family protein [bacterium]